MDVPCHRAYQIPEPSERIHLSEVQAGAAVVAELPAGDLCGVRGESKTLTDVSPAASKEDLHTAVLKAGS